MTERAQTGSNSLLLRYWVAFQRPKTESPSLSTEVCAEETILISGCTRNQVLSHPPWNQRTGTWPVPEPWNWKGPLSRKIQCQSPLLYPVAKALHSKPALPEPLHFSPFPWKLALTLDVGKQIWVLPPLSFPANFAIKPFLFSKANGIVLASMCLRQWAFAQ